MFAFFSLQTVVFLALWFVNFFLTFFKASTSYGYFHYVSYGIFAHWFSLNQIFKFSVSFATEVRSTKDLKRATGHLSPPTNNRRDMKSLLLSWKTCILVHFPRFCWQYFSLSPAFSILLTRKTYFLPCSGFWNVFFFNFSIVVSRTYCWVAENHGHFLKFCR